MSTADSPPPPPARRRRRLGRWLAGAALVAAGALTLQAAHGLEGRAAALVGDNVPVNGGARDPLDVSGHNSPSLVANPTDPANLFVANRVDVPQFACSAHVSFDGGGHWSDVELPPPAGDKVVACFAPDASFGPDGVLHVAYTSFAAVEGKGTVPDSVWLVTSSDGGRTFSPPAPAGRPVAFHVRLLADPSQVGRLYLTWLQAEGAAGFGLTTDGNPLVVARSDDGGRTWGEPVTVTPPERRRAIAPSLAVGRGGVLYLAYLDVGDDKLDYSGAHEGRGGDPYGGTWELAVSRSTDAGATWAHSVVDEVTPSARFLQLSPPTPVIAAHRGSGKVYVVFHDGRGGAADVLAWRSGDGRRWSAPVRVNDTGPADGTSQYLAAASVAPGGRLDVVYYDRRADAENVRNEVSLQSSFDGAESFGPRLRLSQRPFDSRIGFGRDRGLPELGNRLGLVSTEGGALAMWTDTRAGGADTGKQDLAQAVVAVDEGSSAREPMRWAAVGLAGLGGLVLVWSVLTGLGGWRRGRAGGERAGSPLVADVTEAADDDGPTTPAEPKVPGGR